MEKTPIEVAIKTFAEALAEKPKWVIVIDYKGRFIGRYGEYEGEDERKTRESVRQILDKKTDEVEAHFLPLSNEKVTKMTYDYALATMNLTDQLKSSRATVATATGDGSYVVWFTFRYIVGINYSNIGIVSFDRTLDSIYHKVIDLHDTIWEIDDYRKSELSNFLGFS